MSLVDLGKRLLEAARKGQDDEVRNLMANGAPFTTDWVSPLHTHTRSTHTHTHSLQSQSCICYVSDDVPVTWCCSRTRFDGGFKEWQLNQSLTKDKVKKWRCTHLLIWGVVQYNIVKAGWFRKKLITIYILILVDRYVSWYETYHFFNLNSSLNWDLKISEGSFPLNKYFLSVEHYM